MKKAILASLVLASGASAVALVTASTSMDANWRPSLRDRQPAWSIAISHIR